MTNNQNNNQKDFFTKLLGLEESNQEPSLIRKPKIKKESLKEESNIAINQEEASQIEPDIFEETEGSLTLDVYQTPSSIIIESAVAGVNAQDLDIAVSPDSVFIRGKREKLEKVEEKDYLVRECYWGKFSRSVMLPQEIDPDKAQASLKNGVLKIVLPKLNRSKMKRLKVRID